jgi:hypothetical protein
MEYRKDGLTRTLRVTDSVNKGRKKRDQRLKEKGWRYQLLEPIFCPQVRNTEKMLGIGTDHRQPIT